MNKAVFIACLTALSIGAYAGPDVSLVPPQSPESKARVREAAIESHSSSANAYALEQIFTCNRSASAIEVNKLILSLGGHPVIDNGAIDNTEYTIPTPLDILGQPVRQLSIRHNQNDDGDYIEYGAIFKGQSLATVASYADVYQDANGQYVKRNRWSDLIFRSERGTTTVSCASNIRSITKTTKRAWQRQVGSTN